jgi:hypothetical protein
MMNVRFTFPVPTLGLLSASLSFAESFLLAHASSLAGEVPVGSCPPGQAFNVWRGRTGTLFNRDEGEPQ